MPGPPDMSSPSGIHPWVAARQNRVRFGVAYGPQIAPRADWPALVGFVQTAEALGFDSYWTADHPTVWPDCWMTLAVLAARTKTIRLGPLVSCVAYRPAALTARLARDLDDASGGRLVLGLGAGDAPDEFAQLGLAWGTLRERQAALGAASSAILGILGSAPTPHAHQPRIPLLIAGGGERVTLRQVAQYADMANFGAHAHVGGAFTGADIARKLAALRDHCVALDRPYDSILRSHWRGRSSSRQPRTPCARSSTGSPRRCWRCFAPAPSPGHQPKSATPTAPWSPQGCSIASPWSSATTARLCNCWPNRLSRRSKATQHPERRPERVA